MKCPRCDHEANTDQRFCGECGAHLAVVCSVCGTANAAGQNFCGACGSKFGQGTLHAHFATPDAYTPEHLATRIINSQGALEGERKQITVLFADIKDSLKLIRNAEIEEAHLLLDPTIKLMIEAIHRYEGAVNKVLGDGIMALFGAPLAHEDHAIRACYSALAIRDSFPTIARQIEAKFGIVPQFRIGLNSGEVIVRAIGIDLSMEYDAIGQTVHLASRMEQLARPDSIRITEETYRLAKGFIDVQELGPTLVKGVDLPVKSYELRGRTTRTRWEVRTSRGLTRFVGRTAEIDSLARALERAGTGHGQVVALVGDPGVGKSRLMHEFMQSNQLNGWSVHETAGASHGQNTTYLPIRNLLRSWFGVVDRDSPAEIRSKIAKAVLALDVGLSPAIPALISLLDVPVEDSQWGDLAPQQRRRRILESVRTLLVRASQDRPLLLVVEDLHWIDSETQAVLNSLVNGLAAANLLLAVTYRPEYHHEWSSKSYYTRIRIDPLDSDKAFELLGLLLGDDGSLNHLKEMVFARTDGTPLFVEETVQTLVDTGVLSGSMGQYRLARPTRSLDIPATIHSMLDARIDRLPPDEKHLLQTAAVIGAEVPFPLLRSLSGLSDEAMHLAIDHLQAAEFLCETRQFPEREFTFKHALTHDVAYSGLLREKRKSLHADIVKILEEQSGDRLAEEVERLARHAKLGEAWEKAFSYHWQAGNKAMARSANREAVVSLDEALECLDQLPDSQAKLEWAVDARCDLRSALQSLGEQKKIQSRLREAEQFAETLDDPYRQARVANLMTQYFWWTGHPARAVESGQRAQVLVDSLRDLGLKVVADAYLGAAHHAAGEYQQAMDLLIPTIQRLEGDSIYKRFGQVMIVAVFSRLILTQCLAERGEFTRGVVLSNEAIQIAEAADHPNSLTLAQIAAGILRLLRGDLPQAIHVLQRGLDLCEVADVPVRFPWLASALGYANALSGDTHNGIRHLERAASQADAMNVKVDQSRRLVWLGEAYMADKRWDDSLRLAQTALELAKEHGEKGHEGYALKLMGAVVAHFDSPDVSRSEYFYHEALSLADELNMRPLIAHCHYDLGRLFQRKGERSRAAQYWDNAIAIYRDLGMSFWTERVNELQRL